MLSRLSSVKDLMVPKKISLYLDFVTFVIWDSIAISIDAMRRNLRSICSIDYFSPLQLRHHVVPCSLMLYLVCHLISHNRSFCKIINLNWYVIKICRDVVQCPTELNRYSTLLYMGSKQGLYKSRTIVEKSSLVAKIG